MGAERRSDTQGITWRRLYGAGIVVALLFGALTLVTAAVADLPLRDPDGFLGPSYVRLPLIALGMMVLDVLPRLLIRLRSRPQPLLVLREVLAERCSPARLGLVTLGFGVFYVCYVSYRNLKSFLPFLRDDLYDAWLVSTDRWLAFGTHPGVMLHDLLGTGASAELLSSVYMIFLPFVPLSLAAALVWGNDLLRGAWYAVALSLNWILGTLSYYLLPALGPIYVESYRFLDLPDTPVAGLQHALWRNRIEVLADPHATSSVHGIAAFALPAHLDHADGCHPGDADPDARVRAVADLGLLRAHGGGHGVLRLALRAGPVRRRPHRGGVGGARAHHGRPLQGHLAGHGHLAEPARGSRRAAPGHRRPARLSTLALPASARQGGQDLPLDEVHARPRTGTGRPSSALSDVTPASGMPHGTIGAAHDRSQSQLSAKPCMVTPLATRIPIAATLRSGPVGAVEPSPRTQTPERPSTRSGGQAQLGADAR